MNEGKYKEAIIKAKEALTLKEDDLNLKNIAQSYLRMFEYDLALKHFKRALEINPEDEVLRTNLEKQAINLLNHSKSNCI